MHHHLKFRCFGPNAQFSFFINSTPTFFFMQRRFTSLGLALCLLATRLLAQDQPTWKVTLDGTADWMKQTATGTVLVKSTSSQLLALDAATQAVKWKLAPCLATADDVREVPGSPLLLVEAVDPKTLISKIQVVNYLDGKVVFDSKSAKIGKVVDNVPVFALGGILLKTKGPGKNVVLAFLDLDAQKIAWTKEVAERLIDGNTLNPFKVMKAAVGSARRGYVPLPIADRDGQIIYPLKDGVLRLNRQTGATLWEKELETINKVVFDADVPDKLFVAYDGKYFTALDVKSGGESWKKPLKLDGSFVDMFPAGKGFVVVQEEQISKVDVATGQKLWRREPSIKKPTDFFVDKNRLFIAQGDESSAEISAFGLDEGKELWKSIGVKAPLASFGQTPKGILYLSEAGSNIIDLATGKELWRRDLRLKGDLVFRNDPERQATLVYGRGKLFRINTATGEFDQMAEKIEFEGKEDVLAIERRPAGYLLRGVNNYQLLDFTGKSQYKSYVKPFQEAGLTRAGLGALSVAAKAYSLKEDLNSLESTTGPNGETVLSQNENSDAYRDARDANRQSGEFMAMAGKRRRMFGTNSAAYVLSYTDGSAVKNIPTLVKLNKDTGKVEKSFVLKEKDPLYVVDEAENLFYLQKGKEILVYAL